MKSIDDAMQDMANRLYAMVIGLSVSLLFVAKSTTGEICVAGDGWMSLAATVVFWAYLWSEWLWTSMFFMQNSSISRGRAIFEFVLFVSQLNCLIACYVLYVRGPALSQVSHMFEAWEFWFALYLAFVAVLCLLTPRGRFSGLLDVINIGIFVLFGAICILERTFPNGNQDALSRLMLGYFIIATIVHLVHSMWPDSLVIGK